MQVSVPVDTTPLGWRAGSTCIVTYGPRLFMPRAEPGPPASKRSKSTRRIVVKQMRIGILSKLAFSASVLCLSVGTGRATMRVVQKEISVSRALAGHVFVQGTHAPARVCRLSSLAPTGKLFSRPRRPMQRDASLWKSQRRESYFTSACQHRAWIFTDSEFASTTTQRAT